MKVYLQYPWKFPDSPYYKSLIENPPDDVEFENTSNQKGVITNKKFFWISNFLKRNIRRFANTFRLTTPNAHLTHPGNYDLIHCAHCLSKNSDKPWIADIESPWQLYIGKKTISAKKKVEEILSHKNCEKILPWTQATLDELVGDFPKLADKMEVLYPAIPEKKFNKRKKKEINLIFSGRYFFHKGGLHALEAIDELTKKYKHVYGIINSEVPTEIIKKYSNNKKLKFYPLMPQEKLFDLYSQSDIMIYPGYSDSFGFAYLEAMSFGIPVVTVDGYARKEIIEDGKTGFIIQRKSNLNPNQSDEEISRQISEKTSLLIKNMKFMNAMSKNCLKEIKSGKFSIKVRNEKLKNIYMEMLR